MNGYVFIKRELRVYFKKNVRQFPTESNFVVKNLDKSITSKQLIEECKKYGNIISCFVRKEEVNNSFESLGYGYVQFERKEDGDKFLEDMNGKELCNKKISIDKFVPYRQREHHNTNVYIKQFADDMDQASIEKFIDEQFAAFGKILLRGVYKDKTSGKFYAFASFETEKGAAECIQKMNNYKFSDTSFLYVGAAQSKSSRRQMLRKQRLVQNVRTNLYMKFLKSTVDEPAIRKAFEKYGRVTSICLKEWKPMLRLQDPAQMNP